jgi:class 3 adenylate cyclase
MIHRLFQFAVTLLTMSCLQVAYAQNFAIDISNNQAPNITERIQYIHDPKNEFQWNQISDSASIWSRPSSPNVMFDLNPSTTWVRLKLSNSSKSPQRAYLELQPVFLEDIRIFDAYGFEKDATGSNLQDADGFAFPTLSVIVPRGEHTFYLKIFSRANALSIMLRDSNAQRTKSRFDLAMFASIMGGLSVLMIYHIFMFVAYRQRAYIHYSLFLAATLLFTIGFTSFHKSLLPDRIGPFALSFWWSAISAPILFFTLYNFSMSLLLNERTLTQLAQSPRLSNFRKCLRLLPISQVACVIAILLFDHATAIIPVRLSALLHMVLLPAFAVLLWRKYRSNHIASYYALSWIPFAVGTFLVVAWLSGAINHHNILSWSGGIGVLIQSTLLSFATGQQLRMTTLAHISEQRAKLKALDEIQSQFTKLTHRDRVITSYVSSDILKELDAGQDPLTFTPKSVNKCIVFLDMHGYTTFSETHTTLQLYEVINHYFEIINRITYRGGGCVNKIIGDAMMLEFDDPTQCLLTLIELRRELSAANKQRVDMGSLPIKFGMGVSFGAMLVGNFGSQQKYDRTLVGDTVNVASRLESITRNFAVDVLCSKEFVDQIADQASFRPAGYVLLKGKQKKSLVYEMFGHNLPQVIEWKRSTVPHLLRVIELELAGRYEESIAAIQQLIDRCPPHTFKEGIIMDPTLNAMISAIEEKMRQLGLRHANAELNLSNQHPVRLVS